MRSIKVGKIEIRLRGISPEAAQSSIPGLGDELMRQIETQYKVISRDGVIKIGRIDAGIFQTEGRTSPSDLRRMIAGKIAGSIASKVMDTNHRQ